MPRINVGGNWVTTTGKMNIFTIAPTLIGILWDSLELVSCWPHPSPPLCSAWVAAVRVRNFFKPVGK